MHIVEFSRYECALVTIISYRLQGRLPNLVESTRVSQIHDLTVVPANLDFCWLARPLSSSYRKQRRNITCRPRRVKLRYLPQDRPRTGSFSQELGSNSGRKEQRKAASSGPKNGIKRWLQAILPDLAPARGGKFGRGKSDQLDSGELPFPLSEQKISRVN